MVITGQKQTHIPHTCYLPPRLAFADVDLFFSAAGGAVVFTAPPGSTIEFITEDLL